MLTDTQTRNKLNIILSGLKLNYRVETCCLGRIEMLKIVPRLKLEMVSLILPEHYKIIAYRSYSDILKDAELAIKIETKYENYIDYTSIILQETVVVVANGKTIHTFWTKHAENYEEILDEKLGLK